MIERPISGFLAIFGLLACGCSLLQDPDSLTGGTRAAGQGGTSGGAGSAGGPASSAGGSAGSSGFACEPASSDAFCDGLDQQCEPTLTEPACPAGCKAMLLGGVSYMGCAVSATFSDAELLCQAQHMRLVEIDNASENNFVVQLAQTLGSYVWIGGADLAQNGTFAWASGAAFFENGAPVPGAYQNFAPGEPGLNPGLDCVQLHDTAAGPWSAARCADTLQFVCKRQ